MASHFPIKIVITTPSGSVTMPYDFTPSTWKDAARRLLGERDRLLGNGRCLIDPATTAHPMSPKEHVVPQGTGIRWIELPRGATAETSNKRASVWELAFLRDGLLGMLRPFYVEGKKVVEFPLGEGRRIVFRNDPNRGFVIETHDLPSLVEPQPGPGQLRFHIPVLQAPTAYVSRAITKIAYLTLAVVQPKLALSASFDEVRRYLTNEDAPYRSYGEKFCPGAGPQAGVRFDADAEHVGGDEFGGDRFFAIVSIHHVDYYVPLIGDAPLQRPENGLEWFDEPKPAGMRPVTLSFNYDNAEQVCRR